MSGKSGKSSAPKMGSKSTNSKAEVCRLKVFCDCSKAVNRQGDYWKR
ncbi:MAG: hypothetical protein RL424_966 [Pseudomonadota bacterium]